MRRPSPPAILQGFPFASPNVPAGMEVLPRKARMGAAYDSSWAREQPARYARFFLGEGA